MSPYKNVCNCIKFKFFCELQGINQSNPILGSFVTCHDIYTHNTLVDHDQTWTCTHFWKKIKSH